MIELQAIGNIGKDAEQKIIGGKAYASFSICVTEKTSDGKDRTTWLRVMKYDSEGKLTAYLTKGKKVWVRGNPYFSAYVSKNTGEAIPDTTIWADKLVFCSSGEKQNQQTERQSEVNNFPSQADDDDSLPF
jgi:single stranded DNA-binding protein